jgi:hypothetical protein
VEAVVNTSTVVPHPSSPPPPPLPQEGEGKEEDPRLTELRKLDWSKSKFRLDDVAVEDMAVLSTSIWCGKKVFRFLPLAGEPTRYAPVTEEFVAELKEAFPDADVRGAVRRLELRMKTDPTSRRAARDIGRYIFAWVKNENADQVRGGRRNGPRVPPPVNGLRIVNF